MHLPGDFGFPVHHAISRDCARAIGCPFADTALSHRLKTTNHVDNSVETSSGASNISHVQKPGESPGKSYRLNIANEFIAQKLHITSANNAPGGKS
jgi:hypothetical protein